MTKKINKIPAVSTDPGCPLNVLAMARRTPSSCALLAQTLRGQPRSAETADKIHEDCTLFYQAMKGTKPMKQEKILLAPAIKQPIAPSSPRPHSALEEPNKSPYCLGRTDYLPPVQGDALISYKQESISNKILRKLGKGQYNIDAILDLHGLSIEKASVSLADFLQCCFDEKQRVVLIIHGKGHDGHVPLLKNRVNHWLREAAIVLGFCSATPLHGGTGATYVLLKRSREGNANG